MSIKRWDEEASSGDRRSYAGAEVLERSEEAEKQEEEFGALLALMAYADRAARW